MPPRLVPEDPSIFAKCSGPCSKHGPGRSTLNYFGKAYTPRQWAKGPVCENCESPMVKLFEVKVPQLKPRFSR